MHNQPAPRRKRAAWRQRLLPAVAALTWLAACRPGMRLAAPLAESTRADDAKSLPAFDDDRIGQDGELERFAVELGDSPSVGPENAEVTVVMFSDFECPFCLQGYQTVMELRRLYPKQVRVVYKAYPLGNHPHALLAAMAARSAQDQDKFWDFHDLLFSQRGLDVDRIFAYAKQAGLDVNALEKDLAALKWGPQVRRDMRQARRLGVHSTPTFFVNGRHISGAKPLDDFTGLVDAEIEQAKRWRAEGYDGASIYAKAIENGYERVVYKEQRGLDPDAVFVVPLGDSPSKGPADAPITIVAFGDFECPFCARGLETLDSLEKDYGTKLRFVYKHSPLPGHSHAFLAARASMVAHLEGKFWPFHDKLYARRADFDIDDLVRIAGEVGIPKKKFLAAMNDDRLDAAIEADLGLAMALGVSGTPAYFINGRPLEGAMPELEFRMLLAEEFERVAAAKAKGVPAADMYETLTHQQLD